MDHSGKKSKLRLNYLIYPRFQLSLVLIQALILVATQSTLWVQVERVLGGMRERGEKIGFPPDHVYFAFVNEQATAFRSQLLWGSGIALALSAVAVLVLSHRLAGPIVRLRGYMRDVAQKRGQGISKLRFRDGDFFSDLPESVNAALENTGAKWAVKAEQVSDKTDRDAA